MLEIFWLDSALDDLVRLRSFLADVNPVAASKAAVAIITATNKLKEFPAIGKPVDELEGFYDLTIKFGSNGYNLRYRVLYEKIYIVHIKHSRELDFLN